MNRGQRRWAGHASEDSQMSYGCFGSMGPAELPRSRRRPTDARIGRIRVLLYSAATKRFRYIVVSAARLPPHPYPLPWGEGIPRTGLGPAAPASRICLDAVGFDVFARV